MSKARAPKRKEASYYMTPSEIEEIRHDIRDKGVWLKTKSEKKYPDAEEVLDAMAELLGVVEEHELVGKWVSSAAMTRELRDVSFFVLYSFSRTRYINV
jgi:hypothetical protein